MSHRKWRETKQQLILLPDLALLGCCLVDLQFLCDILSGGPVGDAARLELVSPGEGQDGVVKEVLVGEL